MLDIHENDTFVLKIDIEGAELDILDEMLTDESNRILCYTDLIKMEYHKEIFDEGTYLYMKHEALEKAFPISFKEKCGKDLKFKRLSIESSSILLFCCCDHQSLVLCYVSIQKPGK